MKRIASRFLFIASVVSLAAGLALAPSTASACDGTACPCGHGKSGDEAVKLVRQGEAKVGDKTLCPVSGEAFEVTAESPSTEHEGQTVFVCCEGCRAAFEKDAAALLAAVNTKIDEANAAQ